MNDTKLDEIITILRSIILQNQSQNIYENKMVNGLKFENNDIKQIKIQKLFKIGKDIHLIKAQFWT